MGNSDFATKGSFKGNPPNPRMLLLNRSKTTLGGINHDAFCPFCFTDRLKYAKGLLDYRLVLHDDYDRDRWIIHRKLPNPEFVGAASLVLLSCSYA